MTIEDAYRKGYVDATTALAVWDNGDQVVGTMRRPLDRVIRTIETEAYYQPSKEPKP